MALTTRTREDLIRQALEEIEQLGTGMPLEEDDQEKVDNYIDPLLARLAILGLFTGNPGDTEFEIEHFIPLSQMLARDIGPAFGVTGQDLIDANNTAAMAERELRRLLMARPTGEPMETDHF